MWADVCVYWQRPQPHILIRCLSPSLSLTLSHSLSLCSLECCCHLRWHVDRRRLRVWPLQLLWDQHQVCVCLSACFTHSLRTHSTHRNSHISPDGVRMYKGCLLVVVTCMETAQAGGYSCAHRERERETCIQCCFHGYCHTQLPRL